MIWWSAEILCEILLRLRSKFLCAVIFGALQNDVCAQVPAPEIALPKSEMQPDQTVLDGHYGLTQFRVNDNTAMLIDARTALWNVSNSGPYPNPYPFLIDGSVPGATVLGGSIHGSVSLEEDWQSAYNNSSALMVRDAQNIVLCNWRIRQAWDGIRIADNSEGFLIDGVLMSKIRDDAVENDYGASGTITNSMFDGVFSGISMTKKALPDSSKKVVTLDNVLLRLRSYVFKGQKTHQSPFKVEARSPALRIYNSVITIEDVNHIGKTRLAMAWNKTIDSSNNYLLILSELPLPKDYPLPGQGWTVLYGQEARNHWRAAKAQWHAANQNATDRFAKSRGRQDRAFKCNSSNRSLKLPSNP